MLTAIDKIEQSIDLKKGWNWVSFNVEADDMHAESLLQPIEENGMVIKNQKLFLMYEDGESGSDSGWDGSLKDSLLTNDQMYAIKVMEDCNLRIVGKPVDASTCLIKLQKGWNWLGYYGRQVASVADSLAGMEASNGEILKGQSGVTYFNDYEWTGSLSIMEPGVGYMLYATQEHEFGYPASTTGRRLIEKKHGYNRTDGLEESGRIFRRTRETQHFTPIDYHDYSGNAIMAARIVMNGQPVLNAEVGVFADDECRATAVTNANGIAYTISSPRSQPSTSRPTPSTVHPSIPSPSTWVMSTASEMFADKAPPTPGTTSADARSWIAILPTGSFSAECISSMDKSM